MGGKLSLLWKTPAQKENEGKLILPGQLDAGDEIGSYASINDSALPCGPCEGIARRGCVNCPTCQGTGRIPGEQEKQLVALIPYGDQRLKPRRTKLYVCLAVMICLLTTSLSIFFLFPRSIAVLPAGLNASSIGFNATTTSIFLNMTLFGISVWSMLQHQRCGWPGCKQASRTKWLKGLCKCSAVMSSGNPFASLSCLVVPLGLSWETLRSMCLCGRVGRMAEDVKGTTWPSVAVSS
ncbi:transmembrane protein 106A isoform X2 [Falco rusticolus]|nr:transmembrane protein 106A isoform X2 [Falco cherrug]XP_037266975.1 transmembrane protein 106A isoform X2 [Falco rusticolus]